MEVRMNGKTVGQFALLLFLTFLLILPALGQAGRGKARINGVLIDEAGNSIKSAKIVAEFLGEGQLKLETAPDRKGEWAFLGLGTGTWRITASAEGYLPASLDTYVRQLEINPKITLTLKKLQLTGGGVISDETSLELLDQGNQLFTEQKYDEALLIYEQFLEKNPAAYQVYLNIGNCYRERGEYDIAIEKYNIVLEKTSLDSAADKEIASKAMAGIGECYLKKEDLEQAQSYFKKSIDTYPENEFLAYNVGEIFFSNQKIDEAIQYYSLASQIKPEWSDPYYKLGLVYLNKADYARAEENLKKFLTLEPDTERSASVKNILEYLAKIKKMAISQ